MNDQTRQFFVLVVGVSVVGGALWSAVVNPMVKRQDEARAVFDAETAEIAAGRMILDQAGETDTVLHALERHADEYETLWAFAGNASNLYDIVRDFARDAGVTVDRIEPRNVTTNSEFGSLVKDNNLTIERAGYQIDVRGSFESVAQFVRAIQSGTGLSRIEAIRIEPGMTEGDSLDMVRASITTSHFGFDGALPAFADAPGGGA
ncbi:MAG: hypothetical protein R3B49_06780 [Phycisphaerales bacterium]